MPQGYSVWEDQADDLPQDLPGPMRATQPPFFRRWKRRFQIFLITFLALMAQNLGWGVSLVFHAVAATVLGLFIVPLSLGDSSINLETRIGTEEVRFEAVDSMQLDQLSSGGAPIDLSPVVQEIGQTSPLEAAQFEFNPDIQSTSLLPTNEHGAGGAGKGSGTGIGNGIGSGKIEFFGTRGTGNSVVYVVDISGSMLENNRFETARDELLRSLERLSKLQRFYVVFYNHEAIPLFYSERPKKLLVATPAAKTRARKWIMEELQPHGGTQPIAALEIALRLHPDIIYLMTDGEIPPETREFLKQNNKKRTVIHTIAFQSVDGQLILKQIAEDQRGTFRFVP